MKMVIKIMLDTNSYDFLHDNNLIEKFNTLVEKKVIENYGTHVQADEIEKISKPEKKNLIKQISCKFVPSSVGFVGVDYQSKRGFDGSKVGGFKIVDNEGSEIIDKIKTPPTSTHHLGNTADIAIVYTAIKESLEYLISDNDDIFKIFEKLSEKINTNLKVITNQQFQILINNSFST